MTCPHCRTSVHVGASVCTGCQAEVDYGTPRFVMILIPIAAFFLTGQIANLLSIDANWLGWTIFALLVVGGGFGAKKLFKNRKSFKRVYNTK